MISSGKNRVKRQIDSFKNKSVNPIADGIKEIVFGGNDGIITTFAIVTGFYSANLSGENIAPISFVTILLIGFSSLFADGLSMGFSDFLSSRAESDVYKEYESRKEKHFIENHDKEMKKTISIFTKLGYSLSESSKIASMISKNPKYWARWMARNEYGLVCTEDQNVLLKSFLTFASFVLFGTIPLLSFIIFPTSSIISQFIISASFSLLGLAILGILRWKVAKIKFLRSIFEMITIGGLAGLVAFLVGMMFH